MFKVGVDGVRVRVIYLPAKKRLMKFPPMDKKKANITGNANFANFWIFSIKGESSSMPCNSSSSSNLLLGV